MGGEGAEDAAGGRTAGAAVDVAAQASGCFSKRFGGKFETWACNRGRGGNRDNQGIIIPLQVQLIKT